MMGARAFAAQRGQAPTFDTPLSPQQEARYRSWAAALPPNLQNTEDYDLRGAFLGNAQQAANGHLTDTWKKPNHMTFSNESQYSTPDQMGGAWTDGTPQMTDEERKRWVYWASPANLQAHSAADMSDYFRQYEPGSTVVLPIDYRLPRR